MKEYTRLMAEHFHGFRIDNCHSTPIYVAQAFLDHARETRPNLYVIAELFTGSEQRDVVFVRALGVNSLIREAMSAWNPAEMSRLVWKYGGQPCGSMSLLPEYLPCNLTGHTPTDHDIQVISQQMISANDSVQCVSPVECEPLEFRVRPSAPHALFMDCTHDNETPTQKRTTVDTLSNAALVCFASSAIGSVYGYDWLVAKNLNVVHEKRIYSIPGKSQPKGIVAAKKLLQELHYLMGQSDYSEVHVHHEGEFICVSRQNPFTHHGFMMIAHTGFTKDSNTSISAIDLRNSIIKPIMSSTLRTDDKLTEVPGYITGYDSDLNMSLGEMPLDMINITERNDSLGHLLEIHPTSGFVPGSVIVFETDMLPTARTCYQDLKRELNLLHHGSWYIDCVVSLAIPSLHDAIANLGPVELNIALYRVENEEKEIIPDGGLYKIPGYGQLTYAGFQGWVKLASKIVKNNDLSHPFCQHLRQGHWALDYVSGRLERYSESRPLLKPLFKWIKDTFDLVKCLPAFLVPKYFSIVVLTVHTALVTICLSNMPPAIVESGPLSAACALGFHQMYALIPSATLSDKQDGGSLAAGLPHFSAKHMRCWGRDVFISFRGLLLLTGHFEEARDHLLAFASVVRHGLIPNLLDGGRIPRYNARDATWFFVQSLQDYCLTVPNGDRILQETVERRYKDDSDDCPFDNRCIPCKESTVAEILLEIMQKHFDGIHFREFRAGGQLDHAMRDEGFNIDIVTDKSTGFVLGGNKMNCGTWMDKMGDFGEKFGYPATPRDGANIEIIGLLKSALRWLTGISAKGKFAVGVKEADGVFTFKRWGDLVQNNFEKHFYISSDPADDNSYVIDAELVNRRGIYKDLTMSTLSFAEYQFRPNFVVAMVVAPELFDIAHARSALTLAKDMMLGPLGMKTLDPKDWSYRGDYNNSDQSSDGTIAHGFNYHQGPEWVWLSGYFYRAYLKFMPEVPTSTKLILSRKQQVELMLRAHRHMVEIESPYSGLPELTNANGTECGDSCPTQAWSMSTILEAAIDLDNSK